MDIHPIRDDADHAMALRRIEQLWGAPIGSPEGDELDILATLVERYEDERWPSEALEPVAVIKRHMEQTERSQRDLAELLGSRSRASELLAGRRELTLGQIRLLASRWKIPAALLIGRLEDA
jgi:HTH-type transcriptional regulator/antitoxin HigA